jgi:hypothetical protein
MLTLLRVIFGFIVACLVAGAVTVAFVVTPADVASLPPDAQTERLANAGVLALLAATHSAIFAFPFAIITITISELWRIRSWLYHALAATVIALAGLAAEVAQEVPGQPSILNTYAVGAFLAIGVLSGLAYWLVAGRGAGGKHVDASKPPAEAPSQPDTVAEAT